MLQQVLRDSLRQAEQSNAPVRAAALIHIARVMTAFDKGEAVRTLERGLAFAHQLEENDRSVILGEAVSLAATVSPDHAFRLPDFLGPRREMGGMEKVIFDMLHHGRIRVLHRLNRTQSPRFCLIVRGSALIPTKLRRRLSRRGEYRPYLMGQNRNYRIGCRTGSRFAPPG